MKRKWSISSLTMVLGLVLYYLMPVIELNYLTTTMEGSSFDTVRSKSWLQIITLLVYTIGGAQLIMISGFTDGHLKNRTKWLLNSSAIVLFIPNFLYFLIALEKTWFDSLSPLADSVARFHGNVILAIPLAWFGILGIRNHMQEIEEFYKRNFLDSINIVKIRLTILGRIMVGIFLLGLIGYFVILKYGAGQPKDKDDTVRVVASTTLSRETNYPGIYHKYEVNSGDRIKAIHRINKYRMLVTAENGEKGWIRITELSNEKGWRGYLFGKVKIDEIKKIQNPTSAPVAEAELDGYYRVYDKLTRIRILEYAEEKADNPNAHRGMWAKISIMDPKAEHEIIGWLPFNKVRINGQMDNFARAHVWIPIHWLNRLLGDGFWSGLVVFFVFISFAVFYAYTIPKLISLKLRFLPNFMLYAFAILVIVIFFVRNLVSYVDASSFNWDNWYGDGGYFLFGFFALGGSFGAFMVARQFILEERCLKCRYWTGVVNVRDQLSKVKTVTRFTETYVDHYGIMHTRDLGTERKTTEKWDDYCSCLRCGNEWVNHRVETKKY